MTQFNCDFCGVQILPEERTVKSDEEEGTHIGCLYCMSKLKRRIRNKDFILDLNTTVKFEAESRKRNLQRLGYFTSIDPVLFDGHTHYLVYKSKMTAEQRYYPLFGRVQV